MNLEITIRLDGDHDAFRNFARERIEQVTSLIDKVRSAHLVLDGQRGRFQCELVVYVDGVEQPLVAKGEGGELRVALDQALQKLDQQLRKLKDRRVKGRRAPGENTP